VVIQPVSRRSSRIAAVVVCACLAGSATAQPAAPVPTGLPVVNLDGDVTITEPTIWEHAHYRVAGNIFLKTGGTLTVRHAVIELADPSRSPD
jgi:hypothetical protein